MEVKDEAVQEVLDLLLDTLKRALQAWPVRVDVVVHLTNAYLAILDRHVAGLHSRGSYPRV